MLQKPPPPAGKRNDALAKNVAKIRGERSIETLRTQMKEAGYDIGAGTIHRMARGETGVRMESIEKLASYARLSVEELLKGDPEEGQFVEVHRVDVKFSNGHGQVVYYEDEKPPLSFRADFLRKMGIPQGKALVAEAEGVSNEPKIWDGSVVLINSADKSAANNHFFAFRIDGELMIKRLSRLEDVGILATAENSNFTPKNVVYREPVDFEVIGRVVWTGTML